ncbi:MAG: M48 family metalloprotease [Solobacterium sp.]|nr:M48 family metalloprotease [Solobacterium sp.]
MIFKHLLFGLLLLDDLYKVFLKTAADRHQKKPLPEEVKDIYSPEKYQEFLNREHDYVPLFTAARIVSIVLNAFMIYSPFYRWMETLGQRNEYLILVITIVIHELISFLFRLPRSYYATFTIEEKYGLNRKTKKEFFKDELIGLFTELMMSIGLYLFFAFLFRHLSSWAGGFNITYLQAFLLVLVLAAVSFAVIFAISITGYLIQRRMYTYTDLPEGELRDKIMALTKGAKKKIRRIEVYNESKKSTGKNAYMLKILWYRAFGIADNYLDGNSERELLSVLAHEAGHLKHKKTILEYAGWGFALLILIVLAWLLPNGMYVVQLAEQISSAFGLTVNNYVLLISFIGAVLTPLSLIAGIYTNYVSRKNEYEADHNAVIEGYGEELIATFKKMGSDELIDVDPAPVIEFLEHDHPSIVKRIQAIRNAEASR